MLSSKALASTFAAVANPSMLVTAVPIAMSVEATTAVVTSNVPVTAEAFRLPLRAVTV